MDEWQQTLRNAQEHLARHDPKLRVLIEKFGDCTLMPHTDYYRQLVRAIIGQQLSVKAAESIYKKFLELFDGIMPTPEQILEMDDEKIRGVGFSYSKIKYVKDLAAHIVDGRLDLGHIATLPNETIIEQLVAVKGIGEWSAHMFMIFSLGRTNILPSTDLGIRKGFMRIYRLKKLPGTPEMLKISLQNHWNPYQSVASYYLWKSLE
jgi:DNA-3-methyladenine glycosylase II